MTALHWPHFAGVPLLWNRMNRFTQPDIGLFGAVGEMLHPAGIRHLIKKPWLPRFRRIRSSGGGSGRVESRW